MKKNLLCLAALAFLLCAGQANAATTPTAAPSTTLSPQNNRMKSCAAQYHQKNLPKSQYKTFMSSCLKNPSNAAATPASATKSATPTATPMTPTATPAPAAMAPSTMTPPSAMKP